MNYLAHLYIAEATQTSLLGNLLGDFVKGSAHKNFHDDIVTGIHIHRFIDKYTDNHPIVKLSKCRINSYRRRFAGILIDIFYDHFLAKNWHRYSTKDFNFQINDWYTKLPKEFDSNTPDLLKYVLEKMRYENWLKSYADVDGIASAVNRLSKRIRFKNNLCGGAQELVKNYDALENDFFQFFPLLVESVNNIPFQSDAPFQQTQ
ncbi:acyl carrier protein phosphodiesterase [Kaarinaea lacus]